VDVATSLHDVARDEAPDAASAALRDQLLALLDEAARLLTDPDPIAAHRTSGGTSATGWPRSWRATGEEALRRHARHPDRDRRFVDIGDLVANSETGRPLRHALAWVVVLGVGGICVYAEMCGGSPRSATGGVFDLVRSGWVHGWRW
jgi:hypothetical protein